MKLFIYFAVFLIFLSTVATAAIWKKCDTRQTYNNFYCCGLGENEKSCSLGRKTYFADSPVNFKWQTFPCVYSDIDGICRSSTFAPSCTAAEACNGVAVGETGTCPSREICDSTCQCSKTCRSTLSASISGTGTCTVTVGLTSTNCDGKSWEIRDNGNVKCSGTVSGSPYYYTCPSFTVSSGAFAKTYSYSLYVDGTWIDGSNLVCYPPSEFDFSLSVDPTSSTIRKGGSIITTVTVSTISLVIQPVSLSVSGLPSGATYSFTPASCNPTCTSTLAISAADTTPAGSYRMTVTGTGGGLTRTATYDLNVALAGAASPPSVTTRPATNIKLSSAVLNGVLNDLGGASYALVWFEWGTSSSYGQITPVQVMNAPGPFSAIISGLNPVVTYYFRARAKSVGSW